MSASLRIARPFGINLYIHWSFWLIVVWVLYIYLSTGKGIHAAIEGVIFVFAIFACVVLHELGHALAARRYGIPTRDITLWPIGGVARLQRMPTSPIQELVVAIAGPAVNIAIAVILAAILIPLKQLTLSPDTLLQGTGAFFSRLLVVNLFLVAFNMIPAFPMDGGRVLRAILGLLSVPYDKATAAAAAVGQVCAVGFAILGLIVGNPFLIIIAVFVFLGAGAEANAARFAALLTHARVRDATMTDYDTLPATHTVAQAAQQLLIGAQTEFPVTDESNNIIALVTRDALVHALSDGRAEHPLAEVALPPCAECDADEPLLAVYERLRAEGCPAAIVTSGNRPIGILNQEQIAEYIMIRRARRATPTPTRLPAQQPPRAPRA
ncbi:MAG: site-2 protease family protein [Phycisphaerales bacterium]